MGAMHRWVLALKMRVRREKAREARRREGERQDAVCTGDGNHNSSVVETCRSAAHGALGLLSWSWPGKTGNTSTGLSATNGA